MMKPHDVRELVHEILKESGQFMLGVELAEEINKRTPDEPTRIDSARVSNLMRKDRSPELEVVIREKAYDDKKLAKHYRWVTKE